MDLSPTDRLILRDLQKRRNLNLKSSHESSSLSYRQFLRRIDDLFDSQIIRGWVPIVHPLAQAAKKFVWLFLKTNPKDPQDLDYLKSLEGQLLSLDGIAGIFSLLALIQFKNDREFNQSLTKIEDAFKVQDPVIELKRYQHLEIITFYKYNGILVSQDISEPSVSELKLLNTLNKIGVNKKRPPTIEDITENLNISKSSVQKNLKSLEKSNTILGHGILLNQSTRPLIKMVVQFKIHPRSLTDIITVLQEDPQVTFIAKLAQSDYSLLVIVFLNSIQNFNLWLKELYLNDDILDTLTTVVLDDEYKENQVLLFPIL